LDRQCDAYHREPEGEALACFNRLPTFEEFKRASNMRRVVYLWPEQDLVTSGFWRRNGDETLCFQNGPPNQFVSLGLNSATRTTGTPWGRHEKHNASMRRYFEDQPRIHFDPETGRIQPSVRPRPYG
jgi:hypothetical protein